MAWLDSTPESVRQAVLGAKGDEQVETLAVDTTRGSVLHRWAHAGGRRESLLRTYIASVMVTYVPLAIAALLDPLPVTTELRLPFLADWNVAFMLLVSFPSMMMLLVTDQTVLASALSRVQRDGVMILPSEKASRLVALWSRRWPVVNIVGYVIGVAVGLIVGYFNFVVYSSRDVGFWITSQSRLVPAGYVFLACVFVFYAVVPVIVFRTVAISLFLRDAVANSTFRMLPFHPDRCGGLRPVGYLGLRSQYILTILGLNLVTLTVISVMYLHMPVSLERLVIAGAVAYVIIGPIVFFAPLLPFRNGMIRTKAELMGEVSERLRIELQRLRGQLPAGIITKDDEELIERLRKIGAVIDELPVWPFNADTFKGFVTAYIVPMIGAGVYPALKFVVAQLQGAPTP
jgi:hypothetical protein